MKNKVEQSGYLAGLETAENSIRQQISRIRELLPHPGEIGSEVEKVFHFALMEALPERIGVCSGFVQDSKGNTSRQLDVILYDKANAAPIFSKGISVLPSECVYAAGEIKTKLCKAEIKDAFEKCASFKKLDRSAHLGGPCVAEPVYWKPVPDSDLWHPFFFVLAIETSKNKTFHKQTLEVAQKNNPDGAIVDVIVSLDGNSKIFAKPSGKEDLEDGQDHLEAVGLISRPDYQWTTYKTDRPWAMFVALAYTHLAIAPQTCVNMLPYLRGASF